MVWIRCIVWRQAIWPQGPINLQSFLMRLLLPNNYLPTSQRPLLLMNKSSRWVNLNVNVLILYRKHLCAGSITIFTNKENSRERNSWNLMFIHRIGKERLGNMRWRKRCNEYPICQYRKKLLYT